MKNSRKIFNKKIFSLFIMFTISCVFIRTTLYTRAKTHFTQDEKEYMNDIDTLKVVSIDGIAPLSYKNSRGEIVGIGVSILNEVSNLTGFNFKYELYDYVEEAIDSDYDLYLNATASYTPDSMVMSKPYLKSETILYVNSSVNLEQIKNKIYAAIVGGTLPEEVNSENVMFFKNREDTLDAVNSGIADYSYGNAYSVAFYTLQNSYQNIITIPTKKEIREYCIGLREKDKALLSIINKSIDLIGESRIQTLVLDVASQVERKITFPMIIDVYWREIFSIVILVVIALSYSIYSNMKINKQLKIDILEIRKREEEIRYLSFYDNLTGLHNRAYFEKELKSLNSTNKLPISIIMGDVNGLKMMNDIFGHQEGDKLLQRAAQILKESCRPTDTVARVGGDEFAIILPKTPCEVCTEICNKITSKCDSSYVNLIPTSIALGCATKTEKEENIQNIIKTAEVKMYRQKLREGRGLRSSILKSLENSLHERNVESLDRTLRLAEITAKMGEKMGLSSVEMENLNLLARLHNIGKVATGEGALKEEGGLTDKEPFKMKEHPETGYRIAESSQVLSCIADYILAHHERWDGKGYPYGLREREIPLLSRILSVAEYFDTLINIEDRDKKNAISELKKHSGERFDPELVDVLISVVGDDD